MAKTEEAEAAVRSYLLALRDGVKVDKTKTVELRKAIKAAKDPIETLRAVKALREAESEDPLQALEEEFVQNAGALAESEGFTIDDFKALAESMGVEIPAAVLRRALSGGRPARAAARAGGRTRTPLPDEQVLEAIHTFKGASFRIPELAEKLGRDAGIVSLKVKKLVAENVLVNLGDDPNHASRGRAPKLYKVAAKA